MKNALHGFIVVFCLWVGIFPAQAQNDEITFATSSLSIVTVAGVQHDFTVEVAQTGAQRSLGLMNRESLAADAGMLFDFKRPQQVKMWMKNTLISIDMLFISEEGVVESIQENAIPQSTETIPSIGEVRAVLELAGGSVDRLDLAPGDTVVHEIFSQ